MRETRGDEFTGRLGEIAEAIGDDDTRKIIDAFGGTHIYVPERVKPDGPVARVIGVAATKALAAHFGRGALLIPLGPLADACAKRRKILELLGTGASTSEIARQLRVHERTVRRVRNPHHDERQGVLFEG